uniref:Uncharacterized protein n=1 Tax=viral metagenome TaxID=1070528 RepID=A0A6H2A071_9ZZZZ
MNIEEQKTKIKKEFDEKVEQLKQTQVATTQLQQELLILQGKFQAYNELEENENKNNKDLKDKVANKK